MRAIYEDIICWTTNNNEYIFWLIRGPITVSILVNQLSSRSSSRYDQTSNFCHFTHRFTSFISCFLSLFLFFLSLSLSLSFLSFFFFLFCCVLPRSTFCFSFILFGFCCPNSARPFLQKRASTGIGKLSSFQPNPTMVLN